MCSSDLQFKATTRTLLSILIVGSILTLIFLILLHTPAEDGAQNKETDGDFGLERLRKFMQKNVDMIDSYCRQLDRAELMEEQRQSMYLVNTPKEVQGHKKKVAQAKLQLAKREKLIRDNVLYFPHLAQMWCLVPKVFSGSAAN